MPTKWIWIIDSSGKGCSGTYVLPKEHCFLHIYKLYPLHDATSEMSYDLVDLLLRHGAQADVRTTEVKPYTRLQRYLLAWTPKQSIFKLIIIFCLPQMKAPLEICKLLTLRTTDVVEAFNGYYLDGKLFEVVALLMVAWEKLIDNVGERLLIHKRITGEIEKLINEEIKLHSTSNLVQGLQACKNIMTNLQNTLVVLEVFERAGDAIGTYVHRVNSHVLYSRKKDWAMRVFFVKIPFLQHRPDLSRRKLLLYGCEHSDEPMPLLTFVRRGYFSIERAAKKGLRHPMILPTTDKAGYA